MIRLRKLRLTFLLLSLGLLTKVAAQNPIVQTNFTADPAPLVYKDTVFLYTSHDEDDGVNFHMLDWKLYSSTDMANWTDRGTVASLKTFPWAVQTNDAWAPQVVERKGKFYMYVPVSVPGWPKNVIGVAVSDHPDGPFQDALGHPLINKAEGFIDPTVYIDHDGQAYLYWGNPNLWYVKLNKDMISYSGEIHKELSKPANYQEGPWFYERKGHYYLAYASTCCPEGIGYAMSDGPEGPWLYKGMLMEPAQVSSGNHPGIIDYKGNAYLFGFDYSLNFALTPVHRERRSVNVAEFHYNADGTITTLPWWKKGGVRQLGTLNPYNREEAETIAWTSGSGDTTWSFGVRTKQKGSNGVYVTDINNEDYIKVRGVDFEKGAKSFMASVSSSGNKGKIEIHLDSLTGELLGICNIKNFGGPADWKLQTYPIKKVPGVHDLYFVFKGTKGVSLFNFDWWRFKRD